MIDRRFYTINPALPLSEIAHKLGAALAIDESGDEMVEIPAALGESQPGCLSFFSDKRRKDQLQSAKATACLTTEKLLPLVAEAGLIGLVTENPRAAFGRLTQELVTLGGSENQPTKIDPDANVHSTASIGAGVSIGSGTVIGPYCVIEDGVSLGADCVIEPYVRLSFTHLGDGCHIKSGAVVGGSGFGMVEDAAGLFNIPHIGRVMIHDRVQIGSNSCVDRGQLGDTTLSDDVKIDNLVQIGHNVSIGEGTMIAGHAGISGSCVIGKKCLLAGRASLADHVSVGDGAIIAASAGVMSDVPAGQMYSGIPAMPVREHMRNVATLRKLASKK